MSKRERDPFEAYRDACVFSITSDRSLTGSEVRVGVVIALHLNRNTGEAWPAEETLAKLSGHGRDRRNLRRDLDGLHHHIEVIPGGRGRGKTNRYRFRKNAPQVEHLNASPMTHFNDPENASPVRENASRASRKCVRGDARPLKTTESTADQGDDDAFAFGPVRSPNGSRPSPQFPTTSSSSVSIRRRGSGSNALVQRRASLSLRRR
jgi:hypothetical protein